jgi:hypothetical protein
LLGVTVILILAAQEVADKNLRLGDMIMILSHDVHIP